MDSNRKSDKFLRHTPESATPSGERRRTQRSYRHFMVSTKSRAYYKKLLLWALAALVLLAVLGVVGFQFFASWRARDLAGKAMANLENANYRMAWLQINSARDLRPEDPEVLRASATIEGAFGMASAIERWARLEAKGPLTPEDLELRAVVVSRHGSEEQFEEALAVLEKSGRGGRAAALRSARRMQRGDLDAAITEARRAAADSDDPAVKLELARLLLRRHAFELAATGDASGPEALTAFDELVDIVESCQDTLSGPEALAFGLAYLKPKPEVRARWLSLALDKPVATNPAVLAAATSLVTTGERTAAQMHEQLRPVFDTAGLEQRAAFANWLCAQQLPREAMALITAREAEEDTAAFLARSEALAQEGKWEAVLASAETATSVPAAVRLAARARAEYSLGRGTPAGEKSIREALTAAARDGRLPVVMQIGDNIGASRVVDDQLIVLCADRALADRTFSIARDRFSRRGLPVSLEKAYERATAAAADAPSAQDFRRYTALLAGKPVRPEDTASAVVREPTNPAVRATHALALLRAGRPADALAVFDNTTLLFHELPPGVQSVICAVFAANGKDADALALAGMIDPQRLLPGEYALIVGLRTPQSPAAE